MKNLVILGAGTAGTMMSNHRVKKLNLSDWMITLVDQYPQHYCQPGFLFLPFEIYSEDQVVKPKKSFFPESISYIQEKIDVIRPDEQSVHLENGTKLNYDLLIVATGCRIAPEETEGMLGAD